MFKLLSVLTPSYGYGRYLRSALESVEGQKIDTEHIVMDGLSIDETCEILESSRAVWRSEKDDGQSDALNKAFLLSKGEWIGWLNADEFYLPWATRALEDVPADVDVVFGDFITCSADSKAIRLVKLHKMSTFSLKYYGTLLPSCGTFIRRSALSGPSPWSTSLRRVMDWNLWLDLLDSGSKFMYIDTPVAAFRIHDANVTAEPQGASAAEYSLVRSQHGIADGTLFAHGAQKVARAHHTISKAMNGSYLDEYKFRKKIKGSSLAWNSKLESELLEARFRDAGFTLP